MNDIQKFPRRVLPIIFVIETSAPMCGAKLAKVDQIMQKMIGILKDVSEDDQNIDAELKIGVLQFSAYAKWITPGLVSVEDFHWNHPQADGMPLFVGMLDELHAKLSRNGYLNSETGFYVPLIVFLTTGEASDCGDWEEKLEWVRANNGWFRHSLRFAIVLDDEANREVLAKLSCSEETVIEENQLEILKTMIVLGNPQMLFPRRKKIEPEPQPLLDLKIFDLKMLGEDW